MKSIDEIVRVNLTMRMRDLKMNQKTLASKSRLTPAYINKLFKGKKSISKSPSLSTIAKAVGADEVDIYQDPTVRIDLEVALKANVNALARAENLLAKYQSELERFRGGTHTPPEDESRLLDIFRAATADQRAAIVTQARKVIRNKGKSLIKKDRA